MSTEPPDTRTAQPSSALDAVLLHFEAESLLRSYARSVDAQDLAGLASLVSPDVVLVRGQERREGRGEFLRLYEDFAAAGIQHSSHLVTNVNATVLPDGGVRVDASFIALTVHAVEARMSWGRYQDDLVRIDGRLLFAAKRIAVTRTAILSPEMLATVGASTFGPLEGRH